MSLVPATDVVFDDTIGDSHSGTPIFSKDELRAEFRHFSRIFSVTFYEKHRTLILGNVRTDLVDKDKAV